MSRSMKSNIKVGKIKMIWNETLSKMDYYLRSQKGRFILCNPYSGKFIQKGPGLASKQLDRLLKR
jgi:hypothetical protein